MTVLTDTLPDSISRAELESMIVEKAVNDGAFWNLLVNPATTRQALAKFFGKEPPPGLEVKVRVEDASTFYHVVPHPEQTTISVGPPTLEPRLSFMRRVNYMLHADPNFKAEFEKHPASAVANAFNFRFPSHVDIAPLVETVTTDEQGEPLTTLYLVLPHDPHDALFNHPYAIEFDGKASGVFIAASQSLTIQDAITVEAWFRAAEFHGSGTQDALVSQNAPTAGWELRVGGGIPRFAATIDGKDYTVAPQSAVPLLKAGRWYHMVGIYDGQRLAIYLNGELKAATPARGRLTPTKGSTTLGRSSWPQWSDRSFRGLIDEARIWSRAVTEEHLRADRPKKRRAPIAPDPALRGYYPMTEGSGIALPDHSGNGNIGKLVDARWVSTGADAP